VYEHDDPYLCDRYLKRPVLSKERECTEEDKFSLYERPEYPADARRAWYQREIEPFLTLSQDKQSICLQAPLRTTRGGVSVKRRLSPEELENDVTVLRHYCRQTQTTTMAQCPVLLIGFDPVSMACLKQQLEKQYSDASLTIGVVSSSFASEESVKLDLLLVFGSDNADTPMSLCFTSLAGTNDVTTIASNASPSPTSSDDGERHQEQRRRNYDDFIQQPLLWALPVCRKKLQRQQHKDENAGVIDLVAIKSEMVRMMQSNFHRLNAHKYNTTANSKQLSILESRMHAICEYCDTYFRVHLSSNHELCADFDDESKQDGTPPETAKTSAALLFAATKSTRNLSEQTAESPKAFRATMKRLKHYHAVWHLRRESQSRLNRILQSLFFPSLPQQSESSLNLQHLELTCLNATILKNCYL